MLRRFSSVLSSGSRSVLQNLQVVLRACVRIGSCGKPCARCGGHAGVFRGRGRARSARPRHFWGRRAVAQVSRSCPTSPHAQRQRPAWLWHWKSYFSGKFSEFFTHKATKSPGLPIRNKKDQRNHEKSRPRSPYGIPDPPLRSPVRNPIQAARDWSNLSPKAAKQSAYMHLVTDEVLCATAACVQSCSGSHAHEAPSSPGGFRRP